MTRPFSELSLVVVESDDRGRPRFRRVTPYAPRYQALMRPRNDNVPPRTDEETSR